MINERSEAEFSSVSSRSPVFSMSLWRMGLRLSVLGALLCGWFVGGLLYAGEEVGVGTILLKTKVAGVRVPVRVYYPTAEVGVERRFGAWVFPTAKRAERIVGRYPLVVISHGLGGSDWTHYLLVEELIRGGFMVAAVKHPRDLLRVGKIKQALLRPKELVAAIDRVLRDEDIGTAVNEASIGAFGYSLGGYTVLAAAGGHPQYDRLYEHCMQPERDPDICALTKKPKKSKKSKNLKKSKQTLGLDDERIQAIVLAAPFGIIFSELTRVTQPVLLLRVSEDQVLRYPYHAEHIHQLLPQPHNYEVVEAPSHYIFLTPFTKRNHPKPGIDFTASKRIEFLKTVNRQIVQFFKENL